ncbi:hypothetical protein KQP74_20185 [Bacteroides thetaiotaomicron]|jgi:hypothetical protein|uniref:Phage protein n=1 Tax=Bacteroides thetaiotaomicron TaxID=818 RepID=A0AB38UBM4_BACT4|nr:hypothetical protein [Bacteroides thetaiotaomicron]MCS3093192.1 hypothetical protein [Bacteroides thetaiotaomicron]UYU90232.1 hypothetical protein KQP74_20185 [Bacteroides thetaiotaomicron]
MTIIDAIKKGLKAAGVNEKYASKVQKLFKIEKEEDIATYVALFKDNILPDLEDTSAVEKAKKDAIAEYEKNNGLKDGKPIKPVKKTKKTTESEENEENEEEDLEGVPASLMKLFKAQQKQISELANSVTTLTGNITTSSKQASAKVLFDNAKLPEKWFKRIDVNSEISVEDQIKELAEEYAEIRQSAVTDEIENGNYTPQSQVKDRSEKEWLDIMNKEEGAGESSGVASLGIE